MMMLPVFFIALAAPSVLGCCFPEKFTIEVHHADEKRSEIVYFDFTSDKIWMYPTNISEPITYIAADLVTNRTYMFRRSGGCTIGTLAGHYHLQRCVSPTATKAAVDVEIGTNVPSAEAWLDDIGGYRITVSTINGNCVPLIRVDTDKNGVEHKHYFYKLIHLNTTTPLQLPPINTCVQTAVIG